MKRIEEDKSQAEDPIKKAVEEIVKINTIMTKVGLGSNGITVKNLKYVEKELRNAP